MNRTILKASVALSLLVSTSAFAGSELTAEQSVANKGNALKAAEAQCREQYRQSTTGGKAQEQGFSIFMNDCVRKVLTKDGGVADSKFRVYEYEAKEENDLTKAQDKCRAQGLKDEEFSKCLADNGIVIKPMELGQVDSSKENESNTISHKRKHNDKQSAFEFFALVGLCNKNVILSALPLKVCLNLFGIKYKGGLIGKIVDPRKKDEGRGHIRPTDAQTETVTEDSAVAADQ